MSFGKYDLPQGLDISHSVTLTHKGEKITGGIDSGAVVTAYIKSGGVVVSEVDSVVLTRPGSDLLNSVIIVEWSKDGDKGTSTWPCGPCEMIIIADGKPYTYSGWEVVPI